MANPIVFINNAGHGETPIPPEALLKPGDELNVHNSNDGSHRPAKVIAVCPVGTSVEYAIADQTGEARPLMISKPRHRELLYVLEWEGRRFEVLHSKIARGLNRAQEAGLNG
jgi:hypothetical protein